jgi:hypothetical protein
VSSAVLDAQRSRQRQAISAGSAAVALNVRSQVDEVFVVLASLGEALLPLNVFDEAHYPDTLAEVEAAISTSSNGAIQTAFGELKAELQYAVTAGMSFCSCFAPIPVYRGFGAALLTDWTWGRPDMETLAKRLKEKSGSWLGLTKEKGPQANRDVLLAFDQILQMLQVKQVAFFRDRPGISGFAAEQPRFLPKKEKAAHKDIDLLEDWTKKIEKIGHPAPSGLRVTSWGVPWATWDSTFGCKLMKTKDSWETIMTHQMDPGRLLHAFLVRGSLDLADGQILVLAPRTPAETLAIWLEGRPGTNHQVVRWSELDTASFEKKCSSVFGMNTLSKRLGAYPLPDKFVMRHPDAVTVRRPTIGSHTSSSLAGSPVSPPPYSPDQIVSIREKRSDAEEPSVGLPSNAVELDAYRDAIELDSPEIEKMPGQAPNLRPTHDLQHAASSPAPATSRQKQLSDVPQDAAVQRAVSAIQKKSEPTSPQAPTISPAAAMNSASPSQKSAEQHSPSSTAGVPAPLAVRKTMPVLVEAGLPMPDAPPLPERQQTPVPSVVVVSPDTLEQATASTEQKQSPVELPAANLTNDNSKEASVAPETPTKETKEPRKTEDGDDLSKVDTTRPDASVKLSRASHPSH